MSSVNKVSNNVDNKELVNNDSTNDENKDSVKKESSNDKPIFCESCNKPRYNDECDCTREFVEYSLEIRDLILLFNGYHNRHKNEDTDDWTDGCSYGGYMGGNPLGY